jgi:ubiquinone/menaquinone biosynthesis C-methylase UbiE
MEKPMIPNHRIMKLDRKKAIAQTFNKIASPSQYFAGSWITIKAKRNEHKIVATMLSQREHVSGKRALDVGCGVGGYFDILLGNGFNIVGLDIAESMIKVCHSKYAQKDSVELMLADIDHLPFNQNSFDMALCIDTLQYMDEKARRSALENIVQLLKPGALIIVEVKNKACPAYLFKRYQDRLGERYSVVSVTSVLKSSGCEIKAIEGVFPPTFLAPIVVVKARKA